MNEFMTSYRQVLDQAYAAGLTPDTGMPSYMVPEQHLYDTQRPVGYMIDDRFVIRDGKTHPVAIICPGGGYSVVCSFVEGVPFAEKCNERGISALIVYYRVADQATYPAPQDDLAAAVRYALAHAEELNLDMTNYSVWGSSAGGHLAASFGTDNMGYVKYELPKPGAMILIYPVILMDKTLTHLGTHDNLIGSDASPEAEAMASVEQHVGPWYPPTYIWCGDADATVPPENTRQMAQALETAGIPYQCEIFPGIDHGVGLATGMCAEGWIDRAIDFWLDARASTGV